MNNLFDTNFISFFGTVVIITYFPELVITLINIFETTILTIMGIFLVGLLLEGLKFIMDSIERGVEKVFRWIGL